MPDETSTQSSMEDIHDIRGPLVPTSLLWYVLPFLILLISVVLFFLLRRRKKSILNFKETLLTPSERASLELERLKKQELLTKGDFKKFYSFLTEIIKIFLMQHFGYNAPEKTTPEIRNDLANNRLLENFYQNLMGLLERSDLAKFKSQVTDTTLAKKDMEWTYEFIKNYSVVAGLSHPVRELSK